MTDKETKVAVSANPTMVEFPFDEYAYSQALRKAGLDVAGKIRNSRTKLDVYLKTLSVLREHAIARFKKQQEMHEYDLKVAAEAAEKEAVREEQVKASEIDALKARLAALEPTEPVEPTAPAESVKGDKETA